MRKLYLALSFLAFTVISPFGQEVHFPIFNSTITFNQLPPSPPPISRSINTDNYWVAFSTYIQNNLYLQLQSMNVDIKCYGKYQGGYIYHLNIGSNFDDVITKLLEDLTFVNIIPVEPADKIEEPIWKDYL